MVEDFKGKRVLVLGMARSGLAAVDILLKRGAFVTIADGGSSEQIKETAEKLKDKGLDIFIGGYPEIKKEDFDLLVLSPGIPLDIEPIQAAYRQGVPIIGELELAYLIKSPAVRIYAVTGTNGKTTTTALLQAIFEKNGENSLMGGNIGIPLTKIMDELEEGVIAAEVSSFQLETIKSFRPDICGILNITPDHLDRHKNMQKYIEAKAKIFANQRAEDFAVLNYDDDLVRNLASLSKAKVIFFSISHILNEGLFIKKDRIVVRLNGEENEICRLEDILLKGKHNLENVLCAASIALLAGVKGEVIKETLRTFKGVRHRMEEVGIIDGILYVNDSKATNPESALKALEAYNSPVILIAGGRNKGADFRNFARTAKNKVKYLILLGEAKEEIKQAFIEEDFKFIYEAFNMREAVMIAKKLAEKGDVVLLSPACASWDMFKNYEHRGDCFCALVKDLAD
ncbi:UDP-N-acetylmuramoyl-L-alanine--D-glutamate ligase [Thermosyntropha sp.]|uniref:UDP-N-acetylmuramoyl-L-alanine--D-glutamate ligase n=1 Tax=Thermosyntropha sp. TaxID=2740820 RepID=UPI0025D1779C|nr:UDP-N-acetylmuramoyl-L-alanine--D-glutamate ligase [Thermosyntropha sp.]MBO8159320.1 UDP-N-acetylmuramoyl-L-alanine--D-glutamate ligase [Thermosyntropha sp.]